MLGAVLCGIILSSPVVPGSPVVRDPNWNILDLVQRTNPPEPEEPANVDNMGDEGMGDDENWSPVPSDANMDDDENWSPMPPDGNNMGDEDMGEEDMGEEDMGEGGMGEEDMGEGDMGFDGNSPPPGEEFTTKSIETTISSTGRQFLIGEYELYEFDSIEVVLSDFTMPHSDPRIRNGERKLQLYKIQMRSNTNVEVPFGNSGCSWFEDSEYEKVFTSSIDPSQQTMEATIKYDEPVAVRIYFTDCIVGNDDSWDDGNIVDDFRDEETGRQSQVQPFSPVNFQLSLKHRYLEINEEDKDPTISLAKYDKDTVNMIDLSYPFDQISGPSPDLSWHQFMDLSIFADPLVDRPCQLLSAVSVKEEDFNFLMRSEAPEVFRKSPQYDEEDLPMGRLTLVFDGLVRQMLVARLSNQDSMEIFNHWEITISYQTLEENIVITGFKTASHSIKHQHSVQSTAAECMADYKTISGDEDIAKLESLADKCSCESAFNPETEKRPLHFTKSHLTRQPGTVVYSYSIKWVEEGSFKNRVIFDGGQGVASKGTETSIYRHSNRTHTHLSIPSTGGVTLTSFEPKIPASHSAMTRLGNFFHTVGKSNAVDMVTCVYMPIRQIPDNYCPQLQELNFEFRATDFFDNPLIALYAGPATLSKPGATYDHFQKASLYQLWRGRVKDQEGKEPILRVVSLADKSSKISTDYDMSVCFKMVDGEFFQFHSYLTSINSAPKIELICRIEGAQEPDGSLAPRIVDVEESARDGLERVSVNARDRIMDRFGRFQNIANHLNETTSVTGVTTLLIAVCCITLCIAGGIVYCTRNQKNRTRKSHARLRYSELVAATRRDKTNLGILLDTDKIPPSEEVTDVVQRMREHLDILEESVQKARGGSVDDESMDNDPVSVSIEDKD